MKKYLKIGAVVLAFAIIAFVLYFANALVGNPVSSYLVNKNGKVYIEETYSDLDLIVDNAFYDFKRVHTYVISAKSETVEDLHFNLYYDSFGNLLKDNYSSLVGGGENAMHRLNMEYMRASENVYAILENNDIFIGGESFFGDGWLVSTEEIKNLSDIYNIDLTGGIETHTLELDKNYDVGVLGKAAGNLDVSVSFADKDTSFQRGADALKEIKNVFDEQNIGFKYISFGVFNDEGNFAWHAPYIAYDDIDKEDLAEKLKEHSTNYAQEK